MLDAELYADIGALDGLGDNRISAVANQIAHRLDAQAVRDQAVTAAADRRLTIRPGPDAMTYVTALLPQAGAHPAQGAGVYAARNRAADSTVDHRPRGAVMADTLVQRVTGRPAGTPEPVAVNLVLSDQTLLAGTTPRRWSTVMGRFRPLWRAAWSMRRSPMSGLGPSCAGSIGTPRRGRWWRWNHDHDASRAGRPSSSGCGI